MTRASNGGSSVPGANCDTENVDIYSPTGYYDPTDPNNLKAFTARQAFLWAATRVVPEFLAPLTEERASQGFTGTVQGIFIPDLLKFSSLLINRRALSFASHTNSVDRNALVALSLSISSIDEYNEHWNRRNCFGALKHVACVYIDPERDLARVYLEGADVLLTGPAAIAFKAEEDIGCALFDWASRFNLRVDWVIKTVRYLFHHLANNPSPKEAFREMLVQEKKRYLADLRLTSSTRQPLEARVLGLPPSWDSGMESKASYERRWEDDVEKGVCEARRMRDQETEEIKAELEQKAALPLPRKRKRGDVTPEMRYEWAALLRCDGKTAKEIAELYQEDTEVVRRAANRVLEEVGLKEAPAPSVIERLKSIPIESWEIVQSPPRFDRPLIEVGSTVTIIDPEQRADDSFDLFRWSKCNRVGVHFSYPAPRY